MPEIHPSARKHGIADEAIEQNDEWLVGRRYLTSASMGPLLEERPHRHTDEEVLELQAA